MAYYVLAPLLFDSLKENRRFGFTLPSRSPAKNVFSNSPTKENIFLLNFLHIRSIIASLTRMHVGKVDEYRRIVDQRCSNVTM